MKTAIERNGVFLPIGPNRCVSFIHIKQTVKKGKGRVGLETKKMTGRN